METILQQALLLSWKVFYSKPYCLAEPVSHTFVKDVCRGERRMPNVVCNNNRERTDHVAVISGRLCITVCDHVAVISGRLCITVCDHVGVISDRLCVTVCDHVGVISDRLCVTVCDHVGVIFGRLCITFRDDAGALFAQWYCLSIKY